MKKLNSKGFTLIELLAVITIMGILMMVAIPSVSRTIENSRRDTFADVAKSYVNTVRNAVLADELKCGANNVAGTPDGTYYFEIDSSASGGSNDLMESGGKSSWGNSDVKGYVRWDKQTTPATITGGVVTKEAVTKTKYSVNLYDSGNHGTNGEIKEENITRTNIKTDLGYNTNSPTSGTGARPIKPTASIVASVNQVCVLR